MKILVTGSNGLLGQKLTERLQADQSVHLIATARGNTVLPITRGEYHTLDVTDGDAVTHVIDRRKARCSDTHGSNDAGRPMRDRARSLLEGQRNGYGKHNQRLRCH